jgi:hypothetical protein
MDFRAWTCGRLPGMFNYPPTWHCFREGHLYQLFQCFPYLKKYHNTKILYDPSDPVIDESVYELKLWTSSSEFGHLQGKEELSTNMPEPRGQEFVINAKVDADHASDNVTRRSRTGFFVYRNCAPVYWLSKKQTSCETSILARIFGLSSVATTCEVFDTSYE